METKFSSKEKFFLTKEIKLLEKRVIRESINEGSKFMLLIFLALNLTDFFSLNSKCKEAKEVFALRAF